MYQGCQLSRFPEIRSIFRVSLSQGSPDLWAYTAVIAVVQHSLRSTHASNIPRLDLSESVVQRGQRIVWQSLRIRDKGSSSIVSTRAAMYSGSSLNPLNAEPALVALHQRMSIITNGLTYTNTSTLEKPFPNQINSLNLVLYLIKD